MRCDRVAHGRALVGAAVLLHDCYPAESCEWYLFYYIFPALVGSGRMMRVRPQHAGAHLPGGLNHGATQRRATRPCAVRTSRKVSINRAILAILLPNSLIVLRSPS